MAVPTWRAQELAFRTQHAELKERVLARGALLPGSPGTLALRTGTGYGHWYRVYYSAPGRKVEAHVCSEDDAPALDRMRERIAFARWVSDQVSALRRLGFQVADKSTARVLVELHNRGAFAAGLALVGTLAFMAWLNELGVVAAAARTLDLDLARPAALKLAAPLGFLDSMRATGLAFSGVPGLAPGAPSSSVKLPGADGLRVDLLAPGRTLGALAPVPELAWTAQTVPFYDWLLEATEPAAMLAGEHCVPVRLPQASRFVWHKLYSSTQRRGFADKAAKDRQQATLLGAVLAHEDAESLAREWRRAPAGLKRAIKASPSSVRSGEGAFAELLADCLGK